jgi:hypothetical protein
MPRVMVFVSDDQIPLLKRYAKLINRSAAAGEKRWTWRDAAAACYDEGFLDLVTSGRVDDEEEA